MRTLITLLLSLLIVQVTIAQHRYNYANGDLESTISTNPAGANVCIDGAVVGVTPIVITGLYPKKVVPVILDLKGYQSPTIPLRGGMNVKNYPLKKYSTSESGSIISLRKKYSYVGQLTDGRRMVRIKGSNLAGYLDSSGTVIIEPIYKTAYPFMKGIAIVGLGKERAVLGTKGEFIIPLDEYAYLNRDTTREVIYTVQDRKLTIRDYSGNRVENMEFERYTSLSSGEPLVLGAGSRNALLIGNRVVWLPYTKIHTFLKGNRLTRVELGSGIGMIDREGHEVIATQYDRIYYYNDVERVIAYKGGKATMFDLQGRVLTEGEYDNIYTFSESVALCKIDDKYGYLNIDGEIIAKPVYDYASSFSGGIASVRVGKEHFYIDKEIRMLFDKWFDDADSFTKGGVARVESGDEHWLINREGECVDSMKYDLIENNRHINQEDPFLVVKDGRSGYVALDGTKLDDRPYDEATAYHNKYHVATVRIGDKHHIIDTLQNRVTKRDYSQIRPFRTNNQITIAARDGVMGFITTSGDEVGSFDYDNIADYDAKMGIAVATRGGKSGCVDRSGKEIAEIKYDSVYLIKEQFIALKSGKTIDLLGANRESIGRYTGIYAGELPDLYLATKEDGSWVVIRNNEELCGAPDLTKCFSYNSSGVALIVDLTSQTLRMVDSKGRLVNSRGYLPVLGRYDFTLRSGELTPLYCIDLQEIHFLNDAGIAVLGVGREWIITGGFFSGIALVGKRALEGEQSDNESIDDSSVCKYGKFVIGELYYINMDGRRAFDCSGLDSFSFSFINGVAIIREKESKLWGVINTRGKWVVKPTYKEAPVRNLQSGQITVNVDGTTYEIDSKGKLKETK